ncbi:MAG TPA: hypothetical protein VHZ28_13595 [Terracidiphilus sp.]|jgi:hypothetical protein|nr:hypothetical protein [Terracidiphilus sp.]
MIGFTQAYAALASGKSVTRERHDRDNKMYIRNGELMWECYGTARKHQLDWEDMSAVDWIIL